MNVFEFVIILVIAVLAFQLWETKIKHKQKTVAKEAVEDDDVRSKLDDLEGRIEVLERIVTDSKYDLNRQLNELEDDAASNA